MTPPASDATWMNLCGGSDLPVTVKENLMRQWDSIPLLVTLLSNSCLDRYLTCVNCVYYALEMYFTCVNIDLCNWLQRASSIELYGAIIVY